MAKYEYNAEPEHNPYQADCERIVQVCAERGVEITTTTADQAWSAYSDMMAAGWLFLPKDDNELFADVMTKLRKQE